MGNNRPIRTPLTTLIDEFRRGPLIVLVWLGAVGLTGWMFLRHTQQYQFIGTARLQLFEVSAASDGFLRQLNVDLFDDVEEGQVVAQIDDRTIVAQIEVIQATIERLRSELAAQSETLRTELVSRTTDAEADLARLRANEETYRLDALALRTEIEFDKIESQRLQLDLERLNKLVDSQIVSRQEYDLVDMQLKAIQRRIAENETLLTQTERAWEAAREERVAFAERMDLNPDVDVVLQPIHEEIRVQEAAIRELILMHELSTLRAPVTGRVVQLWCMPGQAVVPGEPILAISEHSTTQVVGFIEGNSPFNVEENMVVQVARAADPKVSVEAVVSRVASAVQPLPEQFWMDLNQPRYGRPFMATLTASLPLVPGEPILIRTVENSGNGWFR